jgi:PAS domain S-box-containing protein
MDELIETVSTPMEKTIILYLSVIKDTAGNKFIPVHACRMIAQAAKAPVYALWSGTIGAGAIGGYVLSGEKIGEQTADMCLKILNGEKPSNIPIERYEDAYMFDWRQVKRWSIPEDRLPPDSIVKFKEFTVWDRHKWQIIGAIGLIIFQTLIILLLLHQRRLRRQTENELKDRLQFERKLSELSSEFINLTSENIDSKMIDALAWIGPFMRADRSHMFRFNWDRTEFRITHLWEAEGTKKDEIVLPGFMVKDAFPWLFDNLIGGRDVIVPDVEMLSTEKSINEYQYCRTMGIQSFIILPIEIENAPLCAIGLDSIRQKREWSQEAQDRLRIIGEIFANTIVRRHAEKKSEVDALRYRTVVDFTYDWEYWQKPDGSFQYVSPSCERICGYSAQDLMTNPSLLQDMIVPEDRATWDEHRCSIQKEKPSEEIQFRIQRPDGENRWIEHACQPVFDHQGNYQGVRASNRDITKREFYKSETHQLQTELAHMDRVVTISTLTAALAHEINQPLAAMRSYAQAALRFMDKDHPEYDNVRKALQGIVADNKRAADVVNRLRNLVKKGPSHREGIEINSIINDVIGLINSELVLRSASISLDLDSDVPVIQGDSIQLQQVLINLLTNALDAMDDQPLDTRTIAISTRLENSEEIIVSISDCGGGIPPDTIEAIFSPFHTTKRSGMGLGLSICKSIIEAHGGKIFAENNLDGGATFFLILPSGH